MVSYAQFNRKAGDDVMLVSNRDVSSCFSLFPILWSVRPRIGLLASSLPVSPHVGRNRSGSVLSYYRLPQVFLSIETKVLSHALLSLGGRSMLLIELLAGSSSEAPVLVHGDLT